MAVDYLKLYEFLAESKTSPLAAAGD